MAAAAPARASVAPAEAAMVLAGVVSRGKKKKRRKNRESRAGRGRAAVASVAFCVWFDAVECAVGVVPRQAAADALGRR